MTCGYGDRVSFQPHPLVLDLLQRQHFGPEHLAVLQAEFDPLPAPAQRYATPFALTDPALLQRVAARPRRQPARVDVYDRLGFGVVYSPYFPYDASIVVRPADVADTGPGRWEKVTPARPEGNRATRREGLALAKRAARARRRW